MMTTHEVAESAGRLREGARKLRELEAKLDKDFAHRKTALTRGLESELQRARGEQANRIEDLNQKRDTWREQLRQRMAERAARITEAAATAEMAAEARIDETENRRKFAVQKGTLDLERGRDEAVANAKSEFEDFQKNAGQWRAALEERTAQFIKAFRPFRSFSRLLAIPADSVQSRSGESEYQLIERVQELHEKTGASLKGGGWLITAKIFGAAPLWVWFFLFGAVAAAGPDRLRLAGVSPTQLYQICGGLAGAVIVLYLTGRFFCAPAARRIAHDLTEAEQLIRIALENSEVRHNNSIQSIRKDSEIRLANFHREWELAISEAAEARVQNEGEFRARGERVLGRAQRLHQLLEDRGTRRFKAAVEAENSKGAEAEATLRAKNENDLRELSRNHEMEVSSLKSEWNGLTGPVLERLENANQFAREHFPPWTPNYQYQPPESPLNVVKFGDFTLPLNVTPSDGAPPTITFTGPLNLVFPNAGNLLVETGETGRATAVQTLNNVVLRILATMPPGKSSFTFIDPVRLGESFSALMHLADYEENMVNRRIWTEPAEIDERLAELNAHMEKVIQMYLRNEFPDILAYNKQAGRIAEKYHFLVLADFPTNLGDAAMRRLHKIVTSGARCGVFTLIHWDRRHAFPAGFDAADFLANSAHLEVTRDGPRMPSLGENVKIRLDAPPEPELTTTFLQAVGKANSGSNVVRVPFSDVAPREGEHWSLDTTHEVRIAIGRSGATKLQYLALGKGTRQHALIAGKTGSGKSTLLHVLITNLALSCGPDQIEFYLVDFKKGVEFKDYALANLPHARVIAIESDREFGLSVLRKLDEELRQRGNLFRAVGAQDITAYREGGRKMPRVLLVVDEFQELFVEDDFISQNASLLLDRIVRQGRAFGVHVVLGSQTLGGAYSLARSTLGQMVVRIALQSNEADAYLIMDENNSAPRLLSRPGEGIYNDASGRIEANSPFQVVWLDDKERRQALAVVRSVAEQNSVRKRPILFEGNHPADLRDNEELESLVRSSGEIESPPRVWLGLPNEIKGPTEVLLDRRSGRNLLIVGQQDDSTRALLAAAMLSLAADPRLKDARFIYLEGGVPDQRVLGTVAAVIPQATHAPKAGELDATLRELRAELERREAGEKGSATFLFIHNLSSFKNLRAEDDFSLSYEDKKESAADDFQKVLADGPVHGLHVLAHIDSFNNVSRFLGRKGLREFHARALFQMSAADSASLCDDPRASRLGLNRALLYEEQSGVFELFRPYARPSPEFLSHFRALLVAPRPKLVEQLAGLASGESDIAAPITVNPSA
jgi:S-DNA-T family DNA segregation ATPase FtsK/SpoIIIE